MKHNKELYGKNMDVYDGKTGTTETVIDYIDINVVEGVELRVCLVKNTEDGTLSLKSSRQLLNAEHKHDGGIISKYRVVAYKVSSATETATDVLGDGNLIAFLYDEVKKLNLDKKNEGNVVLHITKKTEITI